MLIYQFSVGSGLVMHNAVDLVFHENGWESGLKLVHRKECSQIEHPSLCVTGDIYTYIGGRGSQLGLDVMLR